MLSKFLRPLGILRVNTVQLLTRIKGPQVIVTRQFFGLIPPDQYDMPLPKKFHLGYVVKVYWETIPLFVSMAVCVFAVFVAIVWACKNKVDIVFSTHNRENISRTMDLRNPTVHKMLTIHQRYEPWPEMQKVLDKMTQAEKRALARATTCAQP